MSDGKTMKTDAAGSSWNFVDLGLPKDASYDWDFHAVAGAGRQTIESNRMLSKADQAWVRRALRAA